MLNLEFNFPNLEFRIPNLEFKITNPAFRIGRPAFRIGHPVFNIAKAPPRAPFVIARSAATRQSSSFQPARSAADQI
jgi:hypothetical protein